MTNPGSRNLSHVQVAELLGSSEPWVYLDVRTPEEFATGHIPGAYNIPFKIGDVAGLHPNPEFVPLVRHVFPLDTKLILGCRSGARAADAVANLGELGYHSMAVHLGSLVGAKDAFGRQQPGWMDAGYPTSPRATPGRTYAELEASKNPSENTAPAHSQ